MRAIDEQASFVFFDAGVARVVVRRQGCDGEPVIEMKLPVAAVIIETIGQVEILLHLDEGQTRADCMDGPRRVVDKIAGRGRAPVDALLDRAVTSRAAQRARIHRFSQADANLAAVFGIDDQPAFVLAARVAARSRRLVVGVDLDRQPLRGEQELHQQRRRGSRRIFEPDLADAAPAEVAKSRGDVGPAPRLFDNTGFQPDHGRSSVSRFAGQVKPDRTVRRPAAYPAWHAAAADRATGRACRRRSCRGALRAVSI